MNLLYLVPFWPYLYTPWLFREVAWMRKRGHHVAVVSLGNPPGAHADVSPFGLADLPVLQVRRQFSSDSQLLSNLMGAVMRGAAAKGSARNAYVLRRQVAEAGWRQGLHQWSVIRRVTAFARRHGAQVVEAHWAAEAGDMALTLRQTLGIPYAVRMHGGDLYRPSPHLPRIIENAGAVCPVSAFLVALLQGERLVPSLPMVPSCRIDLDRLRICHNAIPNDAIAAEPAAQSENGRVIGMTGRLDPEKRHIDLLEAVGPLAGQFPNLRLRFIGGGALEQQLRDRAKELGIADRLEITGGLTAAGVFDELRKLNIYVQTSTTEGFGVATLEGAAQGLPVIASRTGAHPSIVCDGRTGFLYEPGDVPALRRHLATLLGNVALRREMGTAALEHVHQHFEFERLMPRVEAILQAVAQAQPLPL